MKRTLSLLLAAATLVLTFTGCGSKPAASSSSSTSASSISSASSQLATDLDPQEGGVLRIALGGTPKSLDPKFRTNIYESNILCQVLDSLIIYSNDQQEFKPNLATEWSVSDDGLTYTFKLREDVYFQPGQFQDGRQFVASDVKYSLERAKEARNVTLVMLDHVEVVDDFTVKCILKYPDAIFMDALTGPTNMIVPQEEVEGWGDEFSNHVVGTGPFCLVEFKQDESATLARNENYWGPRPYLDGVKYEFVTDANQIFNTLKTGEIDFCPRISGETVKLVSEDPSLTLLLQPNSSINFIGFNMEDPVLSDIRVRQALCMAVDTEELCKGIYQYDEAVPAHQPMPPISWGYDPSMEDYAYEYNPEKARELLAEAGYPDGLKLTLTLSDTAAVNVTRMVTILQQIWKANLNVDLELDISEWSVYSETVTSGKHQIYTVGVSSTVDPHNFTGKCLASKYIGTIPAGVRMNNAEMDELVQESVATPDIAARKEVYKEIVKLAMEQYPAIYYSNDNIAWGVNNKVHGLSPKTYWFLCNSEVNVWMEQ